jgi:hypothetical protein
MVPVSASRVGNERVSERASRSNGTLSDPAGAVIDLGAFLPYTMEMESSCLIWKAVVNCHLYSIAFIAFDGRNRPFAVYSYDLPLEAVRRSLERVSTFLPWEKKISVAYHL